MANWGWVESGAKQMVDVLYGFCPAGPLLLGWLDSSISLDHLVDLSFVFIWAPLPTASQSSGMFLQLLSCCLAVLLDTPPKGTWHASAVSRYSNLC